MRYTSESYSASGDLTWLRSAHGTDNSQTGTFVVANFTAATHYPDGFVLSGTPVNRADLRNLRPWTGGDGEVLGFILFDRDVHEGDGQFAVPVFTHGIVNPDRVPGEFTAPAAGHGFVWSGSDYDEDEEA